jgi:hypothetical protein
MLVKLLKEPGFKNSLGCKLISSRKLCLHKWNGTSETFSVGPIPRKVFCDVATIIFKRYIAWLVQKGAVLENYPSRQSNRKPRAVLVNVIILSSLSPIPVSTVVARETGPETAIQE